MSARIASPCFPRPRFELGLSSRVPQVSAKRDRQSCSIKSRILCSSITMCSTLARPRPFFFSLPMIIVLGVFDDSVTNSLTVALSSWFALLLSVLNNFGSEQLLQRCCHRSTLRNAWRYVSMMSRTTSCNLDDQQDRSLYHTDPAFVIAQLARSVFDSPSQEFHTVSWNPNLFST